MAERQKRIELIEAAKVAERDAIRVKVEAQAEKEAAANRADPSTAGRCCRETRRAGAQI